MLRKCLKCEAEFDGNPEQITCPACVQAAKKDTRRLRTCQVCGSTFMGGPSAKYCPPCRREKQQEANRRYKQNKNKRPLGSIDLCVACGKEYIVNSSQQKYCKDCAQEEVRKKDRIKSKEWNATHTTPQKRREQRDQATAEIECVICQKLFKPSSSARTCSPECSKALKARNQKEYVRNNRERLNEYARKLRANQQESITPEEREACRAKANERARINYAKRIQSKTPEELAAFRKKRNEAARADYAKKKALKGQNKEDSHG